VRKFSLGLCTLALYLLTACTCALAQPLNANTTYKWSYANPDGTTTTGEFTTNEYGQAMFEAPSNVECGRVTFEEVKVPKIAMVESAV
jgi:hypothetical protein